MRVEEAIAIASDEKILDAVASIQCQLLLRGWAVRETYEIPGSECPAAIIRLTEFRVIEWAIACLERTGMSTDAILDELSGIPPQRHWNWLRQRLPNAALLALASKLSEVEG